MNEKKTATYRIISDSGGIYYCFYCDVTKALVCTAKAFCKKPSAGDLERAWKSVGEKNFNRCHECGRWVIDAMYNVDELKCVICSPWQKDTDYRQSESRMKHGFGPDIMKQTKICHICRSICSSDAIFCHVCGIRLPQKTLFEIYGSKTNIHIHKKLQK